MPSRAGNERKVVLSSYVHAVVGVQENKSLRMESRDALLLKEPLEVFGELGNTSCQWNAWRQVQKNCYCVQE